MSIFRGANTAPLFTCMRKLTGILFFLFTLQLYSSNIEYIGGSISYKYILGNCPFANYQIEVTIFTKHNTAGDSIYISYGDGTFGYIHTSSSVIIGNQITKSSYQGAHIYNCGTHEVSYVDTIVNQQIKNLGTNDTTYFFLSSTIVLSPSFPHNNLYSQYSSPALKIFKNKLFNFNSISSTNNTLSYDSIIYSFVNNLTAYNLYLPQGVKINKYSGEIQWVNPDTVDSYIFVLESKMYKEGIKVGASIHNYKFDVISQTESFTYSNTPGIPINSNGFKEIYYSANNTYTFEIGYIDNSADSVKLFSYPIDFFNTTPVINIIKSNSKKSEAYFLWSPLTIDERKYPYNFVLRSISYYPGDSVANSYQTVSFKSSLFNSLKKDDMDKNLKLYPNPTTSSLHISDEQNDLSNSTIEIINNIGQILLQMPFSSSIDVSILPEGCYLITIATPQKQKLYSKFVKY